MRLQANNRSANIASFEQFLEFNRRLSRSSTTGTLRDNIFEELPLKMAEGQTSNGLESPDANNNNRNSGLKMNAETGEIRKLFECPVCYEIVLPPITLCNSGHSVCNSCRGNLKSCPSCRGPFTKVRNRFAEDFLDKCLVKCKYADGGCQVELPGRELSIHHEVCNYRPLICRECDREIPYRKFLDHLRNEENLETQRATECSTGFEIEDEELFRAEGGERFSVWEPTWIHAFGHDFFCFLETLNTHWWIWVGGYATPEECEKFVCSITVWNKENKTEMKYVGKVHPIRASPHDVFSSGLCLSFLDVNLKYLMYKGGIDVLVRIDTEYLAPKTRKGTIVESPLAIFGSDVPGRSDASLRANRINRNNGVRNNYSVSLDFSMNTLGALEDPNEDDLYRA